MRMRVGFLKHVKRVKRVLYFEDHLDTCNKTLSFEFFHVVMSCALHAIEQHNTESENMKLEFIFFWLLKILQKF